MKILFLTSNLGHGHIRAAGAIERAVKKRLPDCQCTYLDFWSLMDARVAAAIKDGYLRMTQDYPDCYQKLYDLNSGIWRQLSGEEPLGETLAYFLSTQQQRWFPEMRARYAGIGNNLDQTLVNSLVLRLRLSGSRSSNNIVLRSLLLLMRSVLVNRLRDNIESIQPDMVVATQMYPAAIFAHLKAKGEFKSIPNLNIATDYGAQKTWANSQANLYCVSNTELAQQLCQWGVPNRRIVVTGIPLMPEFQQPPTQRQARDILNLPQDKKTVLVIGGQYGIGVADTLAALLRATSNYHIIVVACDALADAAQVLKLASRYRQHITLFDRLDNMSHPIAAADVVVGKPGGLSVSESLACGRPFLATCSLGGQEAHNTQYLSRNKVGGLVNPQQLTSTLKHLFSAPHLGRRLQERAYRLGHRHGAEKIADLIQRLSVSKNPDAAYPELSP